MRTSSIRYLESKGYSVDLCVPEKFYDLYRNNPFCIRVFKIENLPKNDKNYDLIILDALSSKCIKIKIKFFYSKPFVTLYEFFNYYRADYNLIFFSWYRIQYLINQDEYIDNIARPFVGGEIESNISSMDISKNSLAIVCGGINDFRTYSDWVKVISIIDKKESETLPLVLVGSDNGVKHANEIVNKFKDRGQLINTVGKYSLSESKSIISCCKLVVGPDGGILQIANALDKKIIALFAQIDSRLRFTDATDYKFLYDEKTVKNINHVDIADAILYATRT